MIRNKEGIIYLILLILLTLLSIFTGSEVLIILLLVVIIYGLISILIVYYQRRILTKDNLILNLSSTPETRLNEIFDIELNAKNNSSFPIFGLDINLKSTNGLVKNEMLNTIRMSLLPKGSSRNKYEISSDYYGAIQTVIDSIFVSDPLRIIRKEVRDFKDESALTLVLPDANSADIQNTLNDRYDMESYRYSLSESGNDPSETIGLKEYSLGDDIRRIHWKLSAKTNQVFLKELGLPVDNRLMILSDKSVDSIEKANALVELTMSVSESLLKEKITHSVGWYSSKNEIFKSVPVTNEDDYYLMMLDYLSDEIEEGRTGSVVLDYISVGIDKNYNNYLVLSIGNENINQETVHELEKYGNVNFITT